MRSSTWARPVVVILSCLVLTSTSAAISTAAGADAKPKPKPVAGGGGVTIQDICNYTTSRPSIRQGSSGAAVKQAQCYLNLSLAIDSLNPRLAVDGGFGPKTDAATRTFQRCARITVDGIIGPQTWSQLSYWANSPTWVPCATPGSVLDIMSWNICGDSDHCKKEHEPNVLADRVVDRINTHGVDVVMLQEVCTAHADGLRSRLGSGWTVVFGYVTRNGGQWITCPNAGGYYGVLIAVRGAITSSWTESLPSPQGREERKAICLSQASKGIKVCNAHFSSEGDDPDRSYKAQQAQYMADLNRTNTNYGYRAIVGGDLNWDPPDRNGSAYADPARQPTLVPLYVSNWECDERDSGKRDGDSTFPIPILDDRKIDYIFANAGGHSAFSCFVEGASTWSDHDLLMSRLVLN